MRFLTAGELGTCLAKLRGDTWLCALVQWRAGLRISEALDLRPADVDLDAGTLTVRSGKGGKTRTVPLHMQLRTALQATAPGADNRPYVTSTRHQRTILRRYKAAGIPDTHALRHSAARHWLNSGVPVNQVQLLLGHADLKTTLIYLRLVAPSPDALAHVP